MTEFDFLMPSVYCTTIHPEYTADKISCQDWCFVSFIMFAIGFLSPFFYWNQARTYFQNCQLFSEEIHALFLFSDFLT